MGQLFVVISGKGGTGKSTVAVGLGSAFQKRGRRVLLVDTDIGLRSLDLMLGKGDSTLFDLGDVLAGRCRIAQAVQPVLGGLSFIAAPQRLEESCNPKAAAKLYHRLAQSYDYVLVDCPAGFGRGFDLAIAGCPNAIVVTAPDPVSLRDGEKAAHLAEERGVETCRLIINRYSPALTLSGLVPDLDTMIDQTGVQLLGVVPTDEELYAAVVTGHPPEKGRGAAALRRIAARMEGQRVSLKI